MTSHGEVPQQKPLLHTLTLLLLQNLVFQQKLFTFWAMTSHGEVPQQKNTNTKFTEQWWKLYQDLPQKFQEMEVSGSSKTKQPVVLSVEKTEEHEAAPYDKASHFNMLRQGKVDVSGNDKFDNIQKKINQQINKKDK